MTLPKFNTPPIIELAISGQFERHPGIGNAHLGLFWHRIRGEYPLRDDAEYIQPTIERFGDDLGRRPPIPTIRLSAGVTDVRLQMSSEDRQRMVQLQNGRVIYNWIGGESAKYPQWDDAFPRFQWAMSEVISFLQDESIKAPSFNMWEVTYVNRVHRDGPWSQADDLHKWFPGMLGQLPEIPGVRPESSSAQRSFLLTGGNARLHLTLNHEIELGHKEKAPSEFMTLTLTARGLADGVGGVLAGLPMGHESIVRTFTGVTGELAHQRWGRTQ